MFKAPIGTANDLQTGIVSVTRNEMRGQDSYDIQLQLGKGKSEDTPKIAQDNNDEIVRHMEAKIDGMFGDLPVPTWEESKENYLVPMFHRSGMITKARYMMSEYTKDSILEQHMEFDSVLAAMASQHVDKMVTPQVNQELVIDLKDLANDPKYGRAVMPEAYVEISPTSKHQRYREIYYSFPPRMKEQIESVWGEHAMWVPQDVIDLAFGQRKYDFIEALDPNKNKVWLEKSVGALATLLLSWNNPFKKPVNGALPNDSTKGRVIRRTKRIEETMIQLTKIGKSTIVVRTLSVIVGNHKSNMAYLKSQGIPLTRILELQQEAGLGAIRYQKDKFELDSLLAKRTSIVNKQSMSAADKVVPLQNLDRRVKQLRMLIADNKVTKLVDIGAMPSIVDDIETGSVQSPHIFGVDALIDAGLKKLPPTMQFLAKNIFMTTDTEGYKMLNNGVKLTDFTARYVLYHHLLSQGVKPDDAISDVMDRFINFDLPTHRVINTLNDVGLVWFSKYGLRILKHIKNTVKDRPFTALTTWLISKAYLGNDNIINSIPFVTKDVGQMFSNAVSSLETTSDILGVDLVQAGGGLIGSVVLPGE
jgi:hypothetical protein